MSSLSAATSHAEITPAGPELGLNSYTTQSQRTPDVAHLSNGGFVAVWDSNHLGEGSNDVIARLFTASDAPRSADFRVNSYAHGAQRLPTVAAGRDGRFVVAWADAERGQIAGRLFSGRAALTDEFQVSFADDPYFVRAPDAAMLTDGSFVVVWNGFEGGVPPPTNAVLARRFDKNGVAVGQSRRIITLPAGTHATPSLGRLTSREVLVAWVAGLSILVKRFHPGTNALGNPLPAAEDEPGAGFPSVAAASHGDIVVVWESDSDIFGRRFDSTFAPLGTEFRVNTYTLAAQRRPVVSFDGSGGFVVAWSTFDSHGPGQDGAGSGIFAREFGPDGIAETDDFLVNTHTAMPQQNPAISHRAPSSLLFAWESQLQDGSGSGIVGRRFDASGATTTTTLQPEDRCGDPLSDPAPASGFHVSVVITVADALFVLKTAVGGALCPLCECDVDDSGSVTATDAVQVLRRALGVPVTLTCPACDD